MSRFTMPINWQEDYFDAINFDGVVELYGKIREDFMGGGKSSMAQAEPSKRQVKEVIARTHQKGMEFNYLLNTTCIGNLEFTAKGYKEIRKTLDWLASINVDTVTVAMPFILEIIKKHYPQFKVNISTQAGVNSLEKAKYWEELGADMITLSHVEMNRNFREIKRITDNCKCGFQLIANMICKRGCPYVTLHGNFNAHSSQTWAKTNRYNIDYYFVSCLSKSFSDPLTVIKSNWIRPEDTGIYESLGIQRFKIAERGLDSSSLALIIEAYRNGFYDGNLMDLIPTMSKYVFLEKRNYWKTMKELFRISFINVFKLLEILKKTEELKKSESYYTGLGLYVDNKKLDGAIEYFIKKDCMSGSCNGCSYCEKLVKNAISVISSESQLKIDTGKFKEIVDKLVEGYYFSSHK